MKWHCEKYENQPTKKSFFNTKSVSIKYNDYGDKLPKFVEREEKEAWGKEDKKGTKNITSSSISQMLEIDETQVRKDIKSINLNGKCSIKKEFLLVKWQN